METKNKIVYVSAMLGALLLLVIVGVGTYEGNLSRQNVGATFPKISVSTNSTAAVINSSCSGSNNLYTEMMKEFSDHETNIGSVSDFSGTAIYPDGSYGITLISPRYAITAWHLSFAFSVGRDITIAGQTHKIVGIEEIGSTDLELVVFDADFTGVKSLMSR